jgi:hypothetical protein
MNPKAKGARLQRLKQPIYTSIQIYIHICGYIYRYQASTITRNLKSQPTAPTPGLRQVHEPQGQGRAPPGAEAAPGQGCPPGPCVDLFEAGRLCKFTPIILHGVVSPGTSLCRMTGVTLPGVVSPEGSKVDTRQLWSGETGLSV